MISYGIRGCEDFDKIQKEAIVGRSILETFKKKAELCEVDDIDTQLGRGYTYAFFKKIHDIDLHEPNEKKLDEIMISLVTLKGYNDIVKILFLEDKINSTREETYLGATKEANDLNELIRGYYASMLIHTICIKHGIDKTNYIEKDHLFQGELMKYYTIVKTKFNRLGYEFDIDMQ